MKHASRPFLLIGAVALATSAVVIGQLGAQPSSRTNKPSTSAGRASANGDNGGGVAGTIGPDVIVGGLTDIVKYGTVNGVSAYAVGTTSCNIGDQVLSWYDSGVNDSLHPVIAQNLYRLKGGRFEQVGQSWLKHGWCAVDGNLCGQCQSDGGCDLLGVGCSDPYGGTLNGTQSDLGPRSQVNPSTGVFPFPFSAPAAQGTIGRRLQVKIDDVNPTLNPMSLYFVEGHYVHPEDAAVGNDNNNASYRRATVGSMSSGSYTITGTGATIQQSPAIYAWRDNGLGVGIPDPSITIVTVDVPGDGRFLVGSKITQIDDTTWRYEYAIQNLNSDAAGQAFSIPSSCGVEVSNQNFHAPFSHSGEPYANDAWTASASSSDIAWATTPFAQNANANALRWGTLYNFGFTANVPPTEGSGTIALFKPIATTSVNVTIPVPSAATPNADLNGDLIVDGSDLGIVLGAWGTTDADLNCDGLTDGGDLAIVLGAWQ
jgi:hypothetical protein